MQAFIDPNFQVPKASFPSAGKSFSERRQTVKKYFSGNGVAVLIFSILIITSLTFGADKDIVKIQGVVMELDLKQNMMIVNEKLFVWNQNTIFHDGKGSPITVDKLKTRTWVYIEGVKDNVRKRAVAEKIFLLPKYIDEKEKHLYPFIQ
jgi:hypothetical protein